MLRVAFSKWRWVSAGSGSFSGSVGQFYGGGFGGPRLVRQSRCEGARGVKLEAWIAPDCAAMTGRLRARSPAVDVTFTAVPE